MKFIFIGGCPRSGTTYLARTLFSNFHSCMLPEFSFKDKLIPKLIRKDLSKSEIISLVEGHHKAKALGYVMDNAQELQTDGLPWNEKARRAITQVARSFDTKAEVFIDHTPSNVFYFDRLQQVFPDAIFINLIRDGRGVYASIKQRNWGPSDPIETATWWSKHLAHGLVRLKGSVHQIRYEDLLHDQDKALSPFMDLLEKRENQQSEAALPDYTAHQHELVNKPAQVSRIDAWQKDLTETEVKLFEFYSGQLLRLLGYSMKYDFDQFDIPPLKLQYLKLKFKLRDMFRSIVKQIK